MSRRPICGTLAAIFLAGGIMAVTSSAGHADSVYEADLMQEVPSRQTVVSLGLSETASVAETLGLPSFDEDQNTCYVTFDNLICREKADVDSPECCEFPSGTKLTITETSSDGAWYLVSDGENAGWCFSAYVSLNSGSTVDSTVDTAPVFDYTEEDLYWLAVAIQYEAGSTWLTDEHQLMVGNVVLNRVASEKFADTIYDVLTSPGQYAWRASKNAVPSQRAYDNAKRLLDGERYLPANVVYQAEFKQGSGVYTSIYDSGLDSTTYFCYI